jgi:arylsulfatase A-like enzyme
MALMALQGNGIPIKNLVSVHLLVSISSNHFCEISLHIIITVRVPLIIYDPRMPTSKRGLIDDNYTLNIDLAPTILGAAGLPPHESMQGRDISDLYLQQVIDGENTLEREPWRQEFFYEFRFGDPSQIPGSDALINHKYKYIEWVENGNYTQLFDLEKDPFEVNDLLHDEKKSEGLQIAQEMQSRLQQWAHTLRDNEPPMNCEAGDDSVAPPQEKIAAAALS